MITEGYAQTARMRDSAVKKYIDGKLNDEEFLSALKKAGFGPTKAKELLDKTKPLKRESKIEANKKAKEEERKQANSLQKKTAVVKKSDDIKTVRGILSKPFRGEPVLGGTGPRTTQTKDNRPILTVKDVLKDYDPTKAIIGAKPKVRKVVARRNGVTKKTKKATGGTIELPREIGSKAKIFVDGVKFLVRHGAFTAQEMEKDLNSTIVDFENRNVKNTAVNVFDRIGENANHIMNSKYFNDFIKMYYSQYFDNDGKIRKDWKSNKQIVSTPVSHKEEAGPKKFYSTVTEDIKRRIDMILEGQDVPTVKNVMANYDRSQATLGRDINGNKYAQSPKEKLAAKRKTMAQTKLASGLAARAEQFARDIKAIDATYRNESGKQDSFMNPNNVANDIEDFVLGLENGITGEKLINIPKLNSNDPYKKIKYYMEAALKSYGERPGDLDDLMATMDWTPWFTDSAKLRKDWWRKAHSNRYSSVESIKEDVDWFPY